MIYTLANRDETMPHVKIQICNTSGDISYSKVIEAYKDLRNLIYGVKDVVWVLDGIADGAYSLVEVIYAGVVLTDGLKGFYRDSKTGLQRREYGKYIRINDVDIVILENGTMLTNPDFLMSSNFDGINGTTYSLKKKRLPRK